MNITIGLIYPLHRSHRTGALEITGSSASPGPGSANGWITSPNGIDDVFCNSSLDATWYVVARMYRGPALPSSILVYRVEASGGFIVRLSVPHGCDECVWASSCATAIGDGIMSGSILRAGADGARDGVVAPDDTNELCVDRGRWGAPN